MTRAAGQAAAPPRLLVWGLATGQLISWGSLFYAFSLFVGPLEQAYGWSKTAINGALTAGLLTLAASAPLVGAWIDRRGARGVMALGSLAGGLLLIAWSQVDSLPALYAVMIGLGAVLAATLYDPAFAVIASRFGADYRRAITLVTLVGGLASTVFMPLTQGFIVWFGWREALLLLAACNLAICLPLHALLLGPRDGRAAAAATSAGRLGPTLRRPAFWGIALWFTALAAASTGLLFLLVPLLVAEAVPMATILAAVAVIGPMQVAGRFATMLFGRRVDTRRLGLAIALCMTAGLALFAFAPHQALWLILAAALFGAGNGLFTIARGTAVPDLLPGARYAGTNGALAFPAHIARALAPVTMAALWAWSGSSQAVTLLALGLELLALAGFAFALAAARRAAAHAPPQ